MAQPFAYFIELNASAHELPGEGVAEDMRVAPGVHTRSFGDNSECFPDFKPITILPKRFFGGYEVSRLFTVRFQDFP